jgi:hypothetical protein
MSYLHDEHMDQTRRQSTLVLCLLQAEQNLGEREKKQAVKVGI